MPKDTEEIRAIVEDAAEKAKPTVMTALASNPALAAIAALFLGGGSAGFLGFQQGQNAHELLYAECDEQRDRLHDQVEEMRGVILNLEYGAGALYEAMPDSVEPIR